MLLPPLNYATPSSLADSGAILNAIELLKQEARLVRDPYVEWADLGVNYYTHGTNEIDGEGNITTDKIIIQDIQNNIITATNIETKDDPVIKLEPVDTGEPPLFFWGLGPEMAAQMGIPPQEYQPWSDETGNPHPPTGLSPQTLMRLQPLTQPQVNLATGQQTPPMLPPNAIQEVSIAEAALMWQKVFDVIWKRSTPRPWFRRNCLMKNILGWQPATYEFDDTHKKHVFKNLPIKQLFIDPTAERVEDAAYVIIDIVFDAEVAKSLFPKYAEKIDLHAQTMGKIQRPSQTLEMGSQYEDTTFQRPIVTFTVAYFRDQPCFVGAEEASESGQVNKQQVGTGVWAAKTPTADAPPPMEGESPELEEETRDAYMHPETGDELTPPHHEAFDPAGSNWPQKRCLRHVTAIATANVLLDDVECKYWDIPLAINICLPVIGKPFGIGDPLRLMRMQDGRSNLMSAVVQHTEFFKSPMSEAPASAREKLPEEYKDGHLHPGMVFWVNDDLLAQHPNGVTRYIVPPPLPPALIDVDDRLKREINDSGGNMNIIQGKDDTAQSGVAIGMKQNAAATMIGFKSQTDEDVLERMAQLAFYAIRTRMTAADIGKIIKKYPPPILEQLVAMGHVDDGLEWNINVKVASGTGSKDAENQMKAGEQRKMGALSMESYRESLGLDHAKEQQRIEKETMEQAKLQSAIQPPAPPEASNGEPRNAGNHQPQG